MRLRKRCRGSMGVFEGLVHEHHVSGSRREGQSLRRPDHGRLPVSERRRDGIERGIDADRLPSVAIRPGNVLSAARSNLGESLALPSPRDVQEAEWTEGNCSGVPGESAALRALALCRPHVFPELPEPRTALGNCVRVVPSGVVVADRVGRWPRGRRNHTARRTPREAPWSNLRVVPKRAAAKVAVKQHLAAGLTRLRRHRSVCSRQYEVDHRRRPSSGMLGLRSVRPATWMRKGTLRR